VRVATTLASGISLKINNSGQNQFNHKYCSRSSIFILSYHLVGIPGLQVSRMYPLLSIFGAAALFDQVWSTPAPQNFPGEVSPQDPRFTYYPFGTPLTGPCDLTTGPDGAIWSSNFITNTIGRVDPTTGEVTEYQVPSVNLTNPRLGDLGGRAGFSCVIQPGSDGFLYAASGIRNELIKINPTTKDIKVFTPPSTGELPSVIGNLEPFNDMWRGPEGVCALFAV